MKKYIIFMLVISVLCISACKYDGENPDKEKVVIETSKNDSEVIIEVNAQTSKMLFRNSNDDTSSDEKDIAISKSSAFDEYTKSNVGNKNFTICGIEHKGFAYVKSEKNQYTEENNDIFENDNAKIRVSNKGEIVFFNTKKALKVFENETVNSEDLAKKYLELIYSNYSYNNVLTYDIKITDQYIYKFCKTKNDINTSDSIAIILNSKGELVSYVFGDVEKFRNIKIEKLNYNDYLERVDIYVKEEYNDRLIDYLIDEEGSVLNIFAENKLELTIPIVINVKDSGIKYNVTKEIVFELN